jgi:hypothetical protein
MSMDPDLASQSRAVQHLHLDPTSAIYPNFAAGIGSLSVQLMPAVSEDVHGPAMDWEYRLRVDTRKSVFGLPSSKSS